MSTPIVPPNDADQTDRKLRLLSRLAVSAQNLDESIVALTAQLGGARYWLAATALAIGLLGVVAALAVLSMAAVR